MPWAKGEMPPIPLRAGMDETSVTLARLQPGVIVNVRSCTETWCRVVVVLDGARDVDGYLPQEKLWGVYPDEKVE
jgi:SH3-like domain-containing protein